MTSGSSPISKTEPDDAILVSETILELKEAHGTRERFVEAIPLPLGVTVSPESITAYATRGVLPGPDRAEAIAKLIPDPAKRTRFLEACNRARRKRYSRGERAEATQPRISGSWLSEYQYPGPGKRPKWGRHRVTVTQRSKRVTVRSVGDPAAPASTLRMDLEMDKNGVLTGRWRERTRLKGPYKGTIYYGCVQFILDPTSNRMEGQWVGFDRSHRVNAGVWRLNRKT